MQEELQSGCGQILYQTPSRFARTNQSRSWNTGNRASDAICFQVDRSGISIVGAGIYSGAGHYDYELELLEEVSAKNNYNYVMVYLFLYMSLSILNLCTNK